MLSLKFPLKTPRPASSNPLRCSLFLGCPPGVPGRLSGMLPYRAPAKFSRLSSSFLGCRLVYSLMGLQKITTGQLPFYYGGPSNRPAVIVLQEWWGVTPEVIQHAEYISEKGKYRVVVPDLYRGKTGVDAEEASHLADGLDFGRAVDDIKEVVEWAKSNGSHKVGVTGFCQGGALACLAAEHAPVSCAVPFYGYPKSHPSKPESIKVPLLAHVGTEDKFFPHKEVEEYVEKIKAGSGQAMTYVYPGEGHAFMNSNPDSFKRMDTAGIPKGEPEDQELAWKRTFDFFKQHLG